MKGGPGLGRLSVHSALETKHIPSLRWDHQEEAGRKKRLSLWSTARQLVKGQKSEGRYGENKLETSRNTCHGIYDGHSSQGYLLLHSLIKIPLWRTLTWENHPGRRFWETSFHLNHVDTQNQRYHEASYVFDSEQGP